VADAYFSKKPMVDAIRSLGMHFISRLRNDASLQYLYQGAYSGKGRPKTYEGFIVVGVMLNRDGTQGHVMMITPGGMVEISANTAEYGKYYMSNGVRKVPRVLECGGKGIRENEAPLCRNVDYKGATERLKWFKYKK
jgi:hypothetical protein